MVLTLTLMKYGYGDDIDGECDVDDEWIKVEKQNCFRVLERIMTFIKAFHNNIW